jgi:hypothetical protein
MYTYMDGVEVDFDSLEPISSPTNPNQTPVLSIENKLNANGWEIPEPKTPIEPTGWELMMSIWMVKSQSSSISYVVRQWRMKSTHLTSRLKWRR